MMATAGDPYAEVEIIESFIRTLRRLTTEMMARFPDDPIVAQAKRQISVAADMIPSQIVSQEVGPYLYKYRDYILSEDREMAERFFLPLDFEEDIEQLDDTDRAQTTRHIIRRVKDAWQVVPEEDKNRYHEEVQSLLYDYIDFEAQRQGIA